MSGAGLRAAVRGYNAELQEVLAELRGRRQELSGRIQAEEAERDRLQGRIVALTERLLRTGDSLAQHLAERAQLDAVIAETEAACGQLGERVVNYINVVPRNGALQDQHLEGKKWRKPETRH